MFIFERKVIMRSVENTFRNKCEFWSGTGAGEEKEVLSAVVREYAATLSTLGDSGDVLTGQLLLQAIGAAAAAMGHDFEPLLLPTLRPLLEKMGDDRWTSSAALALQTVAGALQLASVAQLV